MVGTTIQTIGVVGAGVMGRDVAHLVAKSNYKVILIDKGDSALQSSKEKIRQNVRYSKLFIKDKTSEMSADEILSQIHFTTQLNTIKSADYVIENVTEKFDIKRSVYQELDELCKPDCIFAVNTSVIPITRLASLTERPQRVIGIHFMNPAHIIPGVEVVKGFHTSDKTIKITTDLLDRLGKQSIVVNDSPGFVSNRVLMLTINEAIYLLQEQVASASDIDRIFKLSFAHKMGPLETADLIGLDTILYSIEGLYENFSDSKYRPCPLLRQMVDAGLLGQKSGAGFYNYSKPK